MLTKLKAAFNIFLLSLLKLLCRVHNFAASPSSFYSPQRKINGHDLRDPNGFKKTRSKWTKWNISQLKFQIFPARVGVYKKPSYQRGKCSKQTDSVNTKFVLHLLDGSTDEYSPEILITRLTILHCRCFSYTTRQCMRQITTRLQQTTS